MIVAACEGVSLAAFAVYVAAIIVPGIALGWLMHRLMP